MESDVSAALSPVFLLFLAISLLIGIPLLILTIVAFCKMAAKAGYHWALGLLILVPFGKFILPLFLGFADWPVLRELRQLRQRCGGPVT